MDTPIDQSDPIAAAALAMFEALAAALESQKMVVAHVAGYRAALEESGFSTAVAEEMTTDYHRFLWASVAG